MGFGLFKRRISGGFGISGGAGSDADVSERDALNLLVEGNAIEDQGRFPEALQLYEAAVRLAPNLVRAHLSRGNALLASGKTDEALEAFAAAVSKDPGYAAAHYNRGLAYIRSGRHGDARAALEMAISLKPDFADAEVALGCSLEELGELDAAIECYRRAINVNPSYAEAHYNLGTLLKSCWRPSDAAVSLNRAVALKPDYASAHNNLGATLQDLGQLQRAESCYRRTLEINPDFAQAYSNVLFCMSHTAVEPQALFLEHSRFGDMFEPSLRASWPSHANKREPERTLKVGFVSADLRNHAVAHFLEPLLSYLAASPGLSLHAYSNHTVEDRVTTRMRGYFRHWERVAGLSDLPLATKIQDEGIDILIDLSGHTADNRLLTFARKPAPVQASWIGYPGTTGLKAMDYYLADHHFLPVGRFDSQFIEKLVRLPASVPFLPEEKAPPVNTLPALTNRYMTFGSFNRLTKVSRSAIALWARLMRALPDSRMVLGGMPKDNSHETLIDWFAEEGIAGNRLDFHARSDPATYLGLHHRVDICLDTFPYAGGTTTNHALWMGVPTLTVMGSAPAARQGAAMLGHVGLQMFAAQDDEDFLQKGMAWANDLQALAEVRAGLRSRFAQSPVSRPDAIAAALESALRKMWQRWCAGLPPESFEVELGA